MAYTDAPPTIDPKTFALPENLGRSSRETKQNEMFNTVGKVLGAGTDYANYLTATETARYNQSLGTLRSAATAFDKPSLTDQDISRMYSGAAEASSGRFLGNMGNLRSYIGATGQLGGGQAASMAANFEAQRLASITDATRSLYEKRVEMDMQDRLAKWNAQQAVAGAEGRDPSVVGLDWLGQAGTMALGAYGLSSQMSAAKHAADAQEQAGMWSGIGGALGGLGSLVTAL